MANRDNTRRTQEGYMNMIRAKIGDLQAIDGYTVAKLRKLFKDYSPSTVNQLFIVIRKLAGQKLAAELDLEIQKYKAPPIKAPAANWRSISAKLNSRLKKQDEGALFLLFLTKLPPMRLSEYASIGTSPTFPNYCQNGKLILREHKNVKEYAKYFNNDGSRQIDLPKIIIDAIKKKPAGPLFKKEKELARYLGDELTIRDIRHAFMARKCTNKDKYIMGLVYWKSDEQL